MGALGIGIDARLAHQQGTLAAVTEERDIARDQLGSLAERVQAVEAHMAVELQSVEAMRETLRQRDADLLCAEEQRLKLVADMEAARRQAEENRLKEEADSENQRARFIDEARQLQQRLEHSSKGAEEARDRFTAELLAE